MCLLHVVREEENVVDREAVLENVSRFLQWSQGLELRENVSVDYA